jgi:hypothetical protein
MTTRAPNFRAALHSRRARLIRKHSPGYDLNHILQNCPAELRLNKVRKAACAVVICCKRIAFAHSLAWSDAECSFEPVAAPHVDSALPDYSGQYENRISRFCMRRGSAQNFVAERRQKEFHQIMAVAIRSAFVSPAGDTCDHFAVMVFKRPR